MKHLLLASAAALALSGAAHAADAVYAPVEPVEPVYAPVEPNLMPVGMTAYWNGAYIGLQAGYAFTGDGDLFDERLIGTNPLAGQMIYDPSFLAVFDAGGGFYSVDNEFDDAFEGGVYVGADRQAGRLVFGAIADVNYASFEAGATASARASGIVTDGFTTYDFTTDTSVAGEADIEFYATLRGRVGFAFNNILAYAHGGLAYADVEYEVLETTTTDIIDASGAVIASSTTGSSTGDEDGLFGYAVGGGVEAVVAPRASIKVEYQYTDLGETNISSLFEEGDRTGFEVDFHTVRAGAAFRF